MSLAFIGGTGLYQMEGLARRRTQAVSTRYGTVAVTRGKIDTPRGPREVYFLPRHGCRHAAPPHRVAYRSNIAALKTLGVTGILATAASGCLNPEVRPGDLVLVTSFLDFTKQRVQTFFEGPEAPVVHLDMTEPYCPRLRALVEEAAAELGLSLHSQGVYACTEGPRFETVAEIQMLQRLGADLVGMTNVPEVILAREAEICYAAVAIATNYAAGIASHRLTHTEVEEMMQQRLGELQRLFLLCAERYTPEDCPCRHALDEYRRRLSDPQLSIPL